jgi:UDP-2,4-diacetamido-2,4,6-trideoxy-beta-L-altropyranose hydrolase
VADGRPFVVLADAGPVRGSGHVRRCAALARALLAADPSVRIVFVTNGEGAAILRGGPLDGGLSRIAVHAGTPEAARDLAVREIAAVRSAVAVIDNYDWSAPLEEPLRAAGARIAVVDDLADRPHAADLLLDQNENHHRDDYASLVPPGCRILAGARYAMLQAEFRRFRPVSLAARMAASLLPRVLVSLGGGDPLGQLDGIVAWLIAETDLTAVVATGSSVPCAARLREIAAANQGRVELHFDATNMAELMSGAAFAVASGGTMTWERACLGLPSATLIIADNQVETTRYLEREGYHLVADFRAGPDFPTLAVHVARLAGDGDLRRSLSERSARLTDGTGLDHVVAEMLRL